MCESREYIIAVLSWGMQPDFAGFKRISFEECYNLASLPARGIRGTIQDFYRSFYKCSSLTEIPEDLFLYSENATGFYTCFSKTAITAIPPALFAATHGRDFAITFEGCENLRAIPEDLFANNRRAWSFERCFSDCTGLTSIPEGLFFGAPEADTFCSVFKGCSNIRALPGALFSRNLEAVDLSFIVSNCVNLESIPEELFTCNDNAETFKGAFFGCNSLVTLPEGLFRNNPNVENFSWCFSDCSLLAELPRELFADNRNALDFSYCFRSCYSLRMSPDIFYSDGDQGTRFLGQSVNFTSSFSRSAAYPAAISGSAPDLWNCAGTMTTTECFGDSGNNADALVNYEQIPGSWK